MDKFLEVALRLFVINCIGWLFEAFSDNRREYRAHIASLLCCTASIYIVLQFIYTYLYKELIFMLRHLY